MEWFVVQKLSMQVLWNPKLKKQLSAYYLNQTVPFQFLYPWNLAGNWD